jgi:thymidylate synthase
MRNNLDSWYVRQLAAIARGDGWTRGDKISLVQQTYSHDLGQSLPLLRVKPTPWRSAVKELAWFCSPDYDCRSLEQAMVLWWRPWLKDKPPIMSDAVLPYKKLHAGTSRILADLAARRFDSTRLYCNLWPEESLLHEAALPPCALSHQVLVTDKLNLTVYQRSADLLCGVPTNLAQYAWLATVYAKVAGLPLGTLTFHFGDLHAYKQHVSLRQFSELLCPDRLSRATNLAQVAGYGLPASTAGLRHITLSSSGPTVLSSVYSRLELERFPVVEVHTKPTIA